MRLKSSTILLATALCAGLVRAQADPAAAGNPPAASSGAAVNFRTAPVLQDYAQALDSHQDPSFRTDGIDVQGIQRGEQERSEMAAQTQKEDEDLSQQKESLESEIHYEKTKLEAARRRQAAMVAANAPEKADQAQHEAEDWEARIKTSEAQLAQLNQELQNSLQRSDGAANGSGTVLPGENLEIFVNEDPSFNGRYQVRRGGYIILPQVGRIPVAGKPIPEAENAVKRALEASQLKHASVMIEPLEGADIAAGPLIYLYGEFRNPHPYRIAEGTSPTLFNLILSVGVTDKADLTRVRVSRIAGVRSVVEEINVQRILDGGGLTSDVTLNDGDVVVVPAGQDNVVFVTGNVRRQGPILIKPGEKLTAYGAMLQAGGFARFADQKHVYLLRATSDGKKIKIPINIVAVQKGQTPDIPVQIGDVIVVPERFFSF